METTNPNIAPSALDADVINQTALDAMQTNCPAGSQSYRVQRGDSFYLIARRFGVSVRALMNANPSITAGRLLVGDILCIPTGEGRSCPLGSAAYTVQPGQSVVDVMLASNVSLRALREYNEDIRLTALRPGDVLCVPPGGDRGLCESGVKRTTADENAKRRRGLGMKFPSRVWDGSPNVSLKKRSFRADHKKVLDAKPYHLNIA